MKGKHVFLHCSILALRTVIYKYNKIQSFHKPASKCFFKLQSGLIFIFKIISLIKKATPPFTTYFSIYFRFVVC